MDVTISPQIGCQKMSFQIGPRKKSFMVRFGPIWSDLKSPSKNENVVLTTKPESLKTAMKTNANPHSHSVAISNLKSQIVVVSCLIRAPIPPVFRNTGVPARFAPNFLLVSFEQFVVVLIFGLTFYGSRFTPHTAFPPKLQIPVIRSHQESRQVIFEPADSPAGNFCRLAYESGNG